MTETRRTGRRRPVALGAAVVIWSGGSVAAFRYLDPIVAAFVVILGLTLVLVAVLASDWDSHSTYEEREQVRARRRKEKWERTAGARARDRARWEAHQARQADRADGK